VIRFTLRGLRLIVHMLTGMALVAAIKFSGSIAQRRESITSWWSQRLLAILGLQLQMHGEPHVGDGKMIVANHISWLDIPVIAAGGHTRFVSKSEVRDWPIAGWLANAAGTFYIRRGKGGAAPLIEQLIPFFHSRIGTVTVFPEGTTTNGRQVLPFHPRLFTAAIDGQALLQPVAIQYGLGADGKRIAPYIDDDVLVEHIIRLLKNPGQMTVHLHWLPPIDARGQDRDELAMTAWRAIEAIAVPLCPETTPERVETDGAAVAATAD